MRAIIQIHAYNKEICKENKACNKFSEMLETYYLNTLYMFLYNTYFIYYSSFW